jgi:hypothetical protein
MLGKAKIEYQSKENSSWNKNTPIKTVAHYQLVYFIIVICFVVFTVINVNEAWDTSEYKFKFQRTREVSQM